MLTVRTSENTVITSFRLISERQDFSSVRTGENTVRARARIHPVYNKGDVFVFYREDGKDSFWQCGLNTLVSTTGDPKKIAGGPDKPFCSEAWDAISRYIYTGLQGGSIMKGWMKEENTMIACCSDGTRPVIFKIERIDIPE